MDEMHPLLDKKKQKQARQYEKEKRLLGLISLGVSLALLLTFNFSGLSSLLANLELDHSVVWTFLIYAFVFYGFMTVCGLPLNFYNGYVHEQKWNFSNHTVKSWFWEQAKSFFVGLIILFIVLGLLLWIMAESPRWWWLAAAVAMALVSVVFATLFPVVIAPIFNKYTPIKDRELTEALDAILSRGGLRSSGFFREDMSRQTKKENAFLAGLGKTRRVVLGDNLMDNMSISEIVSIVAHEVGHYKNRHMWKNILIGVVQQLSVFFIVNTILKEIFPEFLTSTRWNLTVFPIFAILLGALSGFLLGPLNNALSRSFEKQADTYALESIEDKKPFVTALAGLADRNLSNAYPEWWMKILFYSHPPIGERLQTAENYQSPYQTRI
jgi:STE24 endopeptidase